MSPEVAAAVEALLQGGLTATSQATLQILERAFQEAAQKGQLRLGLAVRGALEELRRYCEGSPEFSMTRLQALQTRAWLLARNPPPPPEAPQDVRQLELVGIAVQLRRVAGDHIAIEWRLRSLPDKKAVHWSTVSPHKWKADVPLEAYLAVPLKQGFAPAIFLGRHVVRVSNGRLAGSRLSLMPESAVEPGRAFADWPGLAEPPDRSVWENYRPSPLDNETEPQQEVVLEDGTFGLLHYHRCRRVFQPLSRLSGQGREFLNLDESKADPKVALKIFYKTK